ncbi:sigma-54 interaction domain-containing protein [Aneurinibacillus sp. REN35]|uniref:sigma-54 interaction domain-containing protein n=2 Tax=Paenibacillaceae TaxID=186822 RepID=UPI003528BB49
MTKLPANETLTVFSDTSLLELKGLAALNAFPILIVDDALHIIGILEEYIFWKTIALGGCEKPLDHYLNTSFYIVRSLDDINEEMSCSYDYFIIEDHKHYQCYTALEVTTYQQQQKVDSLLKLNESLHEQLENARKENKEWIQILHSSYDEIYVTDAQGKTLFVSESCKKFTGLPPEAYVNKSIEELVKKGLIVNSVTLRTMKTKTVQSAEQTYPNGKTVFTTAKPVFDEEGKLYRIVSNARDISELVEIKHKLKQTDARMKQHNLTKHPQEKTIFFNKLITQSDNMISVIEMAEKVAPMDSSIFIHGESGVGKGVLAKIIHELSPRKDKRFVQVNCGAIPPNLIESELFGYESGAFTGASKQGKTGLVEMADGGTLFLDEIGEMPLDLQVKILHLVQEKTFKKVGGTKEKQTDIRIISATNKNLRQMIQEKTFRQDLYYRLHVVPIRIPPLRERKEDIGLLIDRFLDKFNEKYNQSITLDESSRLILQLHEWPGNIRELENLIEQMVVTSRKPIVSIEDLPFHFNKEGRPSMVQVSGIMPLKQAVEETEKQVLSYALTKHKTTRKMAKALDVNQTTIMRKLHKYQLTSSQSLE